MGIRGKLILLFVVIKVVPLVLLAWFAWTMAGTLGHDLIAQTTRLIGTADRTVAAVGEMAVADSVHALDERARDDIERQTTDTARRIAAFLYQRDEDALLAATLEPTEAAYRQFLDRRGGLLIDHGAWELAPDGTGWRPAADKPAPGPAVDFAVKDNAREFHYRHPDRFGSEVRRPLYLEMTFVGLDGRESVKVTTSERMPRDKRDVSDRRNTYVKAETYFERLKALKPGEVYVSDVIGAYVGSGVVGPYTPEAAAKAGLPYVPGESAYAGKENPVGRRFQGLIRWATPVSRGGRVVGWVTLALDHDHVMEFTDHLVPTTERYSDIPDASAGNYAFIWDRFSRSIAHPRHYFIVGYDPETGEPQIPWLEDRLFEAWRSSGLSYADYIATVPAFRDQGLDKKPSLDLVKQGLVGLDCRYLNFAPQCVGWHDLTAQGGSGSFVILWSGLWKLTTAATIPYYTGQYGDTPRGFGYVTIGANIDEFHRAANQTKERLDTVVTGADAEMRELERLTQASITGNLATTSQRLTVSTLLMIFLVILVAVWMASLLTGRIRSLIDGIARFQAGERGFRFGAVPPDEMGRLAASFDSMADTIHGQMALLEREIEERRRTEDELRAIRGDLEDLVEDRTRALSLANAQMRVEIEERRAAEGRARYLADHDALTGLANRLLFQDRLTTAVACARRSGKYVALLFFDLDRFKSVNDTMGHGVGDALLRHVAATLSASVRATDTVARLGGDEFAIVLCDVEDADAAAGVAQGVIDLLCRPMQIEGHTIHTGTSIGIALFPGETDDPDQLLLHADLAMYQAKADGGNCFHFFAQSLHEQALNRKRLEGELKDALERGQFRLHYQPRRDIVRDRVVGVEALLRWDHPTRGVQAPGAFIDVAERFGILPAIDSWVLGEACRQGRAWHDQGIDFGRIAVNVSPREISALGFPDLVMGALGRTGLSPALLELEVTERAIITQFDAAVGNLKRLRDIGVQIAIDDFGTEHSSLQRLIECPVDVIKVDRFFVSRIGDPKVEAVIAAIVAMGASIEVELVAEGVETDDQLTYLRRLGCRVVQGFIYSPPMDAEAAARHLRESSAAATGARAPVAALSA